MNALADYRIVGFDFAELENAAAAGKDRVPELIELAEQGHVLTATWHADNPWTGGDPWGPTDRDQIADLLASEGSNPAAESFWAEWDRAIEVMSRLRDAGVPIIVRPLHEANGDWFWCGQHDPAVFKELWDAMRARFEAADVHDVLWHLAVAPKTRGDPEPAGAAARGRLRRSGHLRLRATRQPGGARRVPRARGLLR